MPLVTLTLVEIANLESYVFSNNDLLATLGAAEIATRVMVSWICEILHHNCDPKQGKYWVDENENESIESGNLDAEIIFAGCSGTLIGFSRSTLALDFSKFFSRKVLVEAPGLDIVIAHETFDWEIETVASALRRLQSTLEKRKLDRKWSTPLAGLSVTKTCAYTGEPASYVLKLGDRDVFISTEVAHKHSCAAEWLEHLGSYLVLPRNENVHYANSIRQILGNSSSDFVAIIKADINATGRHIERVLLSHPNVTENRLCISAIQETMRYVRLAILDALQQTTSYLLSGCPIRDCSLTLPMLPLYLEGAAGITILTHGLLGLDLAGQLLAALAYSDLHKGKLLHCRAGVAIVRQDTPLPSAFLLANQLEDSGETLADYPDVVSLDWQLVLGGWEENLRHTRHREYQVEAGSLLMRPIRISDETRDWCSMNVLRELIHRFKYEQDEVYSRSKLYELAQALRKGPDATREFRSSFLGGLALPEIPGCPEMAQYGWFGGRCGYYDAIEAMDFFVTPEEWWARWKPTG